MTDLSQLMRKKNKTELELCIIMAGNLVDADKAAEEYMSLVRDNARLRETIAMMEATRNRRAVPVQKR